MKAKMELVNLLINSTYPDCIEVLYTRNADKTCKSKRHARSPSADCALTQLLAAAAPRKILKCNEEYRHSQTFPRLHTRSQRHLSLSRSTCHYTH